MEARSFSFDKTIWSNLLVSLDMTRGAVETGNAKCSRALGVGCSASVEELRPYGQVGVFPGAPLVFLAFLVVDALWRRARHAFFEFAVGPVTILWMGPIRWRVWRFEDGQVVAELGMLTVEFPFFKRKLG